MQVQTVELNKLNPAKYNSRLDLKPGDSAYERLKKSIIEFTCVEPIVWNKKTGNVVGGHQRLKILIELGHHQTDVSVVSLDETREKLLHLALNKLQGDWDLPLLKDLLTELDVGDFDMEIAGFDEKEIQAVQHHTTIESRRRATSKWKAGNREKDRASQYAKYNHENVSILYECPCNVEKKDMHHPDYDFPYMIIKLCNKCHKLEHKRLRALEESKNE